MVARLGIPDPTCAVDGRRSFGRERKGATVYQFHRETPKSAEEEGTWGDRWMPSRGSEDGAGNCMYDVP